jgi:hypothetical protein
VEAVCNPIVSKVYAGAGGGEGDDEEDDFDAHDDL